MLEMKLIFDIVYISLIYHHHLLGYRYRLIGYRFQMKKMPAGVGTNLKISTNLNLNIITMGLFLDGDDNIGDEDKFQM